MYNILTSLYILFFSISSYYFQNFVNLSRSQASISKMRIYDVGYSVSLLSQDDVDESTNVSNISNSEDASVIAGEISNRPSLVPSLPVAQ